VNAAVRNRLPWSRRIESNDHGAITPVAVVELSGDMLAILSVWVEQAFSQSIQWYVMIAWYDDARDIRQALQELLGFGKLMWLGSLCQVAAHHDQVRIEFGGDLQDSFANARYVRWPKM
jgi:hypothetical protein